MKMIIGLFGPKLTGKRDTLKRLIELLCKENNNKCDRFESIEGSSLLRWKNKNIAVAISDASVSKVNERIAFFEDKNWDILIIATKTRGRGSQAVHAYVDGNASMRLIWVGKNYSTSSAEFINEAQAKELYDFIDLIIDKWGELSEDNSSSSDPVTE